MLGCQCPAADGGAVDVDGLASLLPGLELFVHSLLFGDDGSQGVGHLLELLLVLKIARSPFSFESLHEYTEREKEERDKELDDLIVEV